MKTLIRQIIVLALMAFANAAVAQKLEPLEPIYGYIQTGGGIFFQVSSGGCTYPDDFVVQVIKGEQLDNIVLIREHFDLCKAYLPYGTTIFKSYGDLGVQDAKPFKILNPIRTLRRFK